VGEKDDDRSDTGIRSRPSKVGEGVNSTLQRSVRKVLAVLKWRRTGKTDDTIGLQERTGRDEDEAKEVPVRDDELQATKPVAHIHSGPSQPIESGDKVQSRDALDALVRAVIVSSVFALK
jgi:hypothetical protein